MIIKAITELGRLASWLILLGVPTLALLANWGQFGEIKFPFTVLAWAIAVVFVHGSIRVWYTPEESI